MMITKKEQDDRMMGDECVMSVWVMEKNAMLGGKRKEGTKK